VDVTKHEQVADLGALEGEDWHARPPNMPTARRHTNKYVLHGPVRSWPTRAVGLPASALANATLADTTSLETKLSYGISTLRRA